MAAEYKTHNITDNEQWVNFLAATAERAIDEYLASDPEGAAELAKLDGATIQIQCEKPTFWLQFVPERERVRVLWKEPKVPRATISAALGDWIQLGLTQKENRANANLTISGDALLAREFMKTLTNIAFDWETVIARHTNNMFARQAARVSRKFINWQQLACKKSAENIKEYVQEEARLTPSDHELRIFIDEVDAARDNVERLATRAEKILKN